MAETKIGLSQVDKPAPLWYRRFVNATILFFIPMFTGIVQGIEMSDKARNYWMVALVAVPFLLKGIGMILGNGQVYQPSNQTIDSQSEKESK